MKTILFQNSVENQMTYSEVFSHIYSFMKHDPRGNYKLMLGTDSQIHESHTLFITGIVVQRIGKGAWACFRKVTVPRCMTVLHERISYETTLTEEVASLFTKEYIDALIQIVLPYIYKGASFMVEGHIDIGAGERNKTRVYVNEMMARIQSLGIEPKIKPDSMVASSYANKFTK